MITIVASGAAQTISFTPIGDIVYDITLSANCTITVNPPVTPVERGGAVWNIDRLHDIPGHGE